MGKKKLSDKQRKWIYFYKQGKSEGEAAELAGYKANSKHSFAQIGYENLKKLEEHIKNREELLDKQNIADMQEINEFWTTVMNDPEARMQDRLKASELRAKAAGGFINDVNGGNTVVILSGDDKIAD